MSTAVRGPVALTAIFAGIVAFYVWTASTSGVSVRPEARPTGYYNLLADGFLAGRVNLPVAPSAALLALSDPYDPVANAPFRLHDAALYRGRYFLYFGPTPALILFAPFKAVTGRHLPEPLAIAAGCALGVLSAFLLLRHLVLAGFRGRPPTWLWAVSLVTLGLANVAPFLLRRPAVYEVAISVGYGLVFASLLALARGAIGPRPRPAWLAASGVLLGLAAGARFPLFAAGLASAVALAYWAWPGRLTPRDRLRVAVAVAAPLVLAALAIGCYNYARFDSWTEFGIRYTLQGFNPKTYNMFDARRSIYGLLYYLVVPIHWSATFPFANLEPARFLQPPPYLYLEPVAGILATTPLLAALAAGPWLLRRRPLLQASAGTLAAIGTVLLVVFASAGMTMRYEVDFATFFLVPAVLIWMMAIVTSPLGTFRRRILAGVFLALAGFGGTSQILISFTGYYDTLHSSHPQTYAMLRHWAAPVEEALSVPDPRIVLVAACVNPVLLSRGAPVTASNAKNVKAVTDGDPNAIWNAEGYPPQWVEIDLGADSVVHHVTVIPEQTPPGHTEHRISGTTAAGRIRLLGELKGNTASGGAVVLAVPDEAGRGIRKVKVETVDTPRSWVAWREIEIYGCR